AIVGGGIAAKLFERFGTWSVVFYGSAGLALLSGLLAFAGTGLFSTDRARLVPGLSEANAPSRPGTEYARSVENRPVPLLFDAYANGTPIAAPLSVSHPGFSLDDAYAVEAELVRLKQARGARPVGLKVGFANRAMWRILKLDTLVWAHMYDDTVAFA